MLHRQQVAISLLIAANRQQLVVLVLHTPHNVVDVSPLVTVAHVVIRNVGEAIARRRVPNRQSYP